MIADFVPQPAPAGTPVDEWAPAFDRAGFTWLATMPAEEILWSCGDQLRCRLCEQFETHQGAKAHATRHRQEYRTWKGRKQAQVRKEATQRIKQVARLRAEA